MATDNNGFRIVGPKQISAPVLSEQTKRRLPSVSFAILGMIVLGCLLANVIATKDPSYMDLMNYTKAPNREFLFGTDNLGRDIFSCIWYGGRISLSVGVIATVISTVLAILYGSVSGLASDMVDTIMMRGAEIVLTIPSILLVIFIQAVLGEPTTLSIAFVIGITKMECSIAKVVRTEVRQLRKSEYIVASKCMGGSFFHILIRHLGPNFISAIMFMVVMNMRSAIVTESTLSFMGMGLPLEVISWGSLLSLSDKALMTKAWWIIMIPGLFLIVVLFCLTNIGNWLRTSVSQKESNL